MDGAIPAVGVELGLVDDAGHATGEGGDDPVGDAVHPAGVGGAPVDVAGVEVEGVPGGDVVVEDGLVGVHGALGLPGGPGGEVDQGDVVGGGLPGGIVVPAGLEEGAEVEAVGGRPAPTGGEDDDARERGETIPGRSQRAAGE